MHISADFRAGQAAARNVIKGKADNLAQANRSFCRRDDDSEQRRGYLNALITAAIALKADVWKLAEAWPHWAREVLRQHPNAPEPPQPRGRHGW